MVRIFERSESHATFCTVKCFSTGEGFRTKSAQSQLNIRTILQKECSMNIRVTAQNVKSLSFNILCCYMNGHSAFIYCVQHCSSLVNIRS